jgi:hypothetical protein
MSAAVYKVSTILFTRARNGDQYLDDTRKEFGYIKTEAVWGLSVRQEYTRDLHKRIAVLVDRLASSTSAPLDYDVNTELEYISTVFGYKVAKLPCLQELNINKAPYCYAVYGGEKPLTSRRAKTPDAAGLSYGTTLLITGPKSSLHTLGTIRHEYAHLFTPDEGFTNYLSIQSGLLSGERLHLLSALEKILSDGYMYVKSYQSAILGNQYNMSICYMDWKEFEKDFLEPLEILTDAELLAELDESHPYAPWRQYSDRSVRELSDQILGLYAPTAWLAFMTTTPEFPFGTYESM